MTDTNNPGLILLLGQIDGKLNAHLEAAAKDRVDRDADRTVSALYRKEVREELAEIKSWIAAQGARLAALDADDNDHSLVNRVKAIEPAVADIKKKIAIATLTVSAGVSLAGYALYFFGVEVKGLALRLFKVS